MAVSAPGAPQSPPQVGNAASQPEAKPAAEATPAASQPWVRPAPLASPAPGTSSFQGTASEERNHLKGHVEVVTRGAELALWGVPAELDQDAKKLLGPDAGAQAHKVLATLSDEQLGGLSVDQLGRMAKALAADKPHTLQRSKDLLRVLTAHGTDAGHIDAVSSRLGYLVSPLGVMSGSPKAQLQKVLQAGAAKPGDWKGFQRYLDAATGTVERQGTTVTPLINGSVAFPKMFDAIDHASSSVNLSVFGFDSDRTGREMAEHLVAAAKRGLAVRLVYDPMGSDKTGEGATDAGIYDYMRQNGVEVIEQKPGALADHLTHRKLLVVDGSTGFIGGMNVGDNWSTHWHDVHSEVHGTAVPDMQRLFVDQWRRDGGKLTQAQEAALFPSVPPRGMASARIIGHDGRRDQNMKLAYLRAIDTAQTSINIADPYFSDPDVVAHLEAAASRHVTVNVVLPHTNDKPIEQDAERALYTRLIKAGVHVFEYTGAPMAHEKVATFDGKVSTIGSSNLDMRSLFDNDEDNVWSSDASVAQRLDQDLFAQDMGQSLPVLQYKPGLLRGLVNGAASAVSSKL